MLLPMHERAVEETYRRHGGAVHALAERLLGSGPAAADVTCRVVVQLASPAVAAPPSDGTDDELAAQCIALAYFGRLRYPEIAELLGVPAEVVKVSIRTGLRSLWADGAGELPSFSARGSRLAV